MTEVRGIHHVTTLASSAPAADAFWRGQMGLARVKMTVNTDRPDAYHLFYGDADGTPGTVVTVSPFPNLARGAPGVGEIGDLALAVGVGALQEWRPHMDRNGYPTEPVVRSFDHNRLFTEGPDGQRLALQVSPREQRRPAPGPHDGRQNVRGIHSAQIRVRDGYATGELLRRLGYEVLATEGHVTRYALSESNGTPFMDVCELPDAPAARMGAGSIHHLSFGVPARGMLEAVRTMLAGADYEVTEIDDRIWFESFYFRGPDGLLFEVATRVPGLTTGEPIAERGASLHLPDTLEDQRTLIEATLEPLDG